MRRVLGLAGVVVLMLGGCIAERQGRYTSLGAPDVVSLCGGNPTASEQARCRRAFAQDAMEADAAETVRLRYAMQQVGTGLARMDDPGGAVRCSESRVDGQLVTACTAAPRPAR